MTTTTANETALKSLEEKIYRIVSSYEGYLMQVETDRLYELRDLCGKKWDAACQTWRELGSPYDGSSW